MLGLKSVAGADFLKKQILLDPWEERVDLSWQKGTQSHC